MVQIVNNVQRFPISKIAIKNRETIAKTIIVDATTVLYNHETITIVQTIKKCDRKSQNSLVTVTIAIALVTKRRIATSIKIVKGARVKETMAETFVVRQVETATALTKGTELLATFQEIQVATIEAPIGTIRLTEPVWIKELPGRHQVFKTILVDVDTLRHRIRHRMRNPTSITDTPLRQ